MRLKPRFSWVPAPTAPVCGVPHPLPCPSLGALHSIFLLPSSFLGKDSHSYQAGLRAPQLSPHSQPTVATGTQGQYLLFCPHHPSQGPLLLVSRTSLVPRLTKESLSSPKPTRNHPHTLCKSGNSRRGLSSFLTLSIHLWGPALTHPLQPAQLPRSLGSLLSSHALPNSERSPSDSSSIMKQFC